MSSFSQSVPKVHQYDTEINGLLEAGYESRKAHHAVTATREKLKEKQE